jgi:hypothetical protein
LIFVKGKETGKLAGETPSFNAQPQDARVWKIWAQKNTLPA